MYSYANREWLQDWVPPSGHLGTVLQGEWWPSKDKALIDWATHKLLGDCNWSPEIIVRARKIDGCWYVEECRE